MTFPIRSAWTAGVLLVATLAAPAAEPTTAPAEALTVEQLRRLLADDAAEKREQAVVGLLDAGRNGRQVLAVEAARLIRDTRKALVPRTKRLPRDAQGAIDAHAAWRKGVKDTLRIVRRTTTNNKKEIDVMMKSVRKTLGLFAAFRTAVVNATRRQAPVLAELARLNEYEQVRARAVRGHRPHTHKLHELVAVGGGRYPVAFEKVLSGHRRMDAIKAAIDRRNRKSKDKIDAQEYECLGLLNAYRRKMGMVPLAWNTKLYAAGRQHSKEMSDLSYFSHISPIAVYRTIRERAAMAGYRGYRNLAENIAIARGAASVHFMWQISPSHHLQILNPTHREIGIGRDGRRWTEMFGTRGKNPWDGSAAPPADYMWVHRK